MFAVNYVRISRVLKLIIEAVKQLNLLTKRKLDLNSQYINEEHIDIDSDICRETPSLKTGIKLPTNDKKWEMAK